jgi:hypothetical protein
VTVTEICRRPDGLPLAVELAAARIRALSPTKILNSLHDAFRLPTGGARTAVRRQQTLRASVDWSHALLSELEQVLFRRLAVFLGAFDLDAAQALAGGEGPTHAAGRQVIGSGRRKPARNPLPAPRDGSPIRDGKARRDPRRQRRADPSSRPKPQVSGPRKRHK